MVHAKGSSAGALPLLTAPAQQPTWAVEECEEPTLCSASSLADVKLSNTDHGDKSAQVHVPAPPLPSSNRHRHWNCSRAA